MTDQGKCPKCGSPLPADAPAGVCPKCLLAAGLASNTDIRDESAPGVPTTPMPSSSRFVPPRPEDLARLFPQLEILELIGAGGMGAVYKARQPGLDRLVAVKILPPEVGADPSFAQRFMREAQALARLGHQHIVSVYDFGVAGELYYFIMEYVDGANLRQLIRTGEMQAAEALAIVPQICEALQFAHDEGVVHRDIKPENILLDKRGRVKIADFGLARLLGKSAPEFSLTGTNQVLGTLHYMAPEQIQGLRTVDHRADIYSLGVVFYEMLTGELPLGRFAPPSQKVELDVRLDEVVLRSLENKPERRYQQASQVKSDVERISLDSAVASVGSKEYIPAAARGAASDSAAEKKEPLAQSLQKLASALSIFGGVGLVAIIVLAIWLAAGGAERLFPYHIPQNPPYDPVRRSPNIWWTIWMTLVLTGLYAIVAVPQLLIAIVAGLLLRNQKAYWLAIVACVLAVLPITFVFPIGLPIGLWGLAVLTSQEVRAAFARQTTSDQKTPSERLFWPAIGLLVAAIVDGGQALILIGAAVSMLPMRDANRALEPLILGVVALALGVLRLAGGVQMLKIKSRTLCAFASVASLLPFSFGSLIGIPAGIWALIELARSDAKEAFARQNENLGTSELTSGLATPAHDAVAVSVDTIRQRLAVPATLLQIAGLLLSLAAITLALLFIFDQFPEDPILVYGIVIAALVIGSLLIVTGWKLKRLQDYGLCVATTLLLLPVSTVVPSFFLASNSPGMFAPLFLLFPVAVWILVLLLRTDVKAAFVSHSADSNATTSGIGRTFHESSAPLVGQAEVVQDRERQFASRTQPDANLDEDDRQRAAELSEIAPDWMAYVMMGLFGVGWVLVGLMWNFRHAAVAIAIFAMFLIFLWIVQWKLAYLPKLRLEIGRQPVWKKVSNGVIVALMFFVGMVCVIAGQVTLADFMTDTSRVAPTSLNGTHAKTAAELALRSAHFEGLSDKSTTLWMRGGSFNPMTWSNLVMSWFSGVMFLFAAAGGLIHTRRYRYTWKHWWAPTLSVVVGLLAALMFVHFIHAIFVEYQSGSRKVREIRSTASRDAVETGIDRWAAEETYLKLEFCDWQIQKDGADVGEIHARHLLARSWFDRYRASWSYMFLRPKPPLYITLVSSDAPAEAYLRVEYPFVAKNSPEEAMWMTLLDGLEARIRAAATEEAKTRVSAATTDDPKE